MKNANLATHNESKAEEVRVVFKGSKKITIRTSRELGFGTPVEDRSDRATLEGNAEIKARFVHERDRDCPAVADDTGIFMLALAGRPGANAAYWGGEELSTEGRMHYCLEQLKDQTVRRALFRTVAVVIMPDGSRHVFDGKLEGEMLLEPRCAPHPSMPYSSIFHPLFTSKTLAEMTVEERDKISHRGQAFRKVRAFLESSL